MSCGPTFLFTESMTETELDAHPTPASLCHPQPTLHIAVSNPFPLYHCPTLPQPLTPSPRPQIAPSLGNPCLGPRYLDRLIMLPLEQSRCRYLRPVCVHSIALSFFLALVLSLQMPNRNGITGALRRWLCASWRAAWKDKRD